MPQSLPPYQNLRILLAVAQARSIRHAATQLNRSESAVSHQIRKLERQLGQTLIEKEGRGIRLTTLAHRYVSLLRYPFDAIDEGVAMLSGPRQPDPAQIVITMAPSVASMWFIPRLARFEAAWPNVSLRLATTSRILDFEKDGIDIAIRYDANGDQSGRHPQRVVSEFAFPVCAPSIADGAAAFWRYLNTGRIIGNDAHPDDWSRWQTRNAADSPCIQPTVRMTDSSMTLEAAAQGYGVAIGRLPIATPMLRDGRLLAPLGMNSTSGGHYSFECADRAMKPMVTAVCDWLYEAFRQSCLLKSHENITPA